MKIFIDSKRRKTENILKKHPGAVIIDVTSNGNDDFRKLSPFYPVGGIPVPGMKEKKALCVEGIWQGLKIFEDYNWDEHYFNIAKKNIKRTVRKFGKVKGHFYNGDILSYVEARKKIYLPAYKYVLEEKMNDLVEQLRTIAKDKPLVLLDYTTNDNILDPKKPLSHAAVIKAAILKNYGILEKKETSDNEAKQGKLF